MITLDEFLKTDEQKLEEDCENILGILKLNKGSVSVQGAKWQKGVEDGSEKWRPNQKVSEYFGLDPVRLHEALLLLRKRGLLRYGAVDDTRETDRGSARYGRQYFWVRFSPSYKKALECEIVA